MPSDTYRPRLSVDITQQQHETLQTLIPHGALKPLIGLLVEDLVTLITSLSPRDRTYFFGAIITRKVRYDEVLPTLKGATNGSD